MKTFNKKVIIAAAISFAASGVFAQSLGCTKIGFHPGTQDPNNCYPIASTPVTKPTGPAPVPKPATTTPVPKPTGPLPRPKIVTQQVTDENSVVSTAQVDEGTSQSLVAVFPPPVSASAPSAQNCIVTRSEATAAGWSFISRATAEQYSDPVCVMMWLHTQARTQEQADMLFEKIMQRISAE